MKAGFGVSIFILVFSPLSFATYHKHGYQPSAANQVLLKDFKPISQLKTKISTLPRAKFPVIDVHSHVNDAAGIQEHRSPQEIIKLMNDTNVQTVVILTGQWGNSLQAVIDEMVKPHPGRFVVFTQIDWSKLDSPTFVQDTIKQLQDSVRRGAKGLKILKDFGLTVAFKSGQLLAIDDRRLDPIWAECGRLGIPVAIHTSDPAAFFQPLDSNNERYEELVENPDWSFADSKYPRKENLLAARDRVIARFPKTKFVLLHMANWPENLDYVDQLLAKYPNTAVEFGARVAELGRQPRRTRQLFIKFQDRIMFGSDNELSEELYRTHFRWLETADEYFDYPDAPAQGRWKIYGLNLPDPVLRKIYSENARKWLGL